MFSFPKEIHDIDVDFEDLTLPKRSQLLYSADESDVKFMFPVDSNLEVFIYAHKRILSIGSCVFDQMFNGLMASSSSNTETVVRIPDISMACFKNLLTFIYIGAVELNLDNIMEVMYAAEKYQVCKLESVCSEFLYKRMDNSNVLQIYELTSMFDNTIRTLCLQWIDETFEELTKTQGFMNLKKTILIDILKRDTLNVRELNLFKAVFKWAEKQCCDASVEPSDVNIRTAADNFSFIRFPTMTFSEYAECTRFGSYILTPEQKIDVWDALAGVKRSEFFNSVKRIKSPSSYRAFTFSYFQKAYVKGARYSFCFRVNRIVRLSMVHVLRNCRLIIYEQAFDEPDLKCAVEHTIDADERKLIHFTFMPNVQYNLVTVDLSFECDSRCSRYCAWSLHNCKPPNFESYEEMEKYYNRAARITTWNFAEHDPFVFEGPQWSLIRTICYSTSRR